MIALQLIRIVQLFQKYIDHDHPLKQEDTARHIDEDYRIVIERKATSRNISHLKKAGFEIKLKCAGSDPDKRDFTDVELRILIDSVSSCKHITASITPSMPKQNAFTA